MNSNQLDHTAAVLGDMLTFKQPADAVLSNYFRNHNKLGRQDRHEIAETSFAAIRHYQKIATVLRRPHAQSKKAALTALVLGRGLNISQLKDFLNEEETEFLAAVKARKSEFFDDFISLISSFKASLGASFKLSITLYCGKRLNC